jgi:8-oxo-dGTP pyrophosphatase MutT (NUDIX family)
MRRAWRGGGIKRNMTESTWKPHTTVAAICEREGRYLLVREQIDGEVVFNQPAGHLEPGESLLQAVVRETMEETLHPFTPTALVGIYRYQAETITFIRFLFRGEVNAPLDGELDPDILSAEWLDYDEIVACRDRHRTPMVLQCIEDARRKSGYPLDVLSHEFA